VNSVGHSGRLFGIGRVFRAEKLPKSCSPCGSLSSLNSAKLCTRMNTRLHVQGQGPDFTPITWFKRESIRSLNPLP
jgi:hypothetical protein